MRAPTPADRALLESHGLDLYEQIVQSGGIAKDDPRLAPGTPAAEAIAVLARIGLIHADADDAGRWVAEDPSAAHSRVVSPLSVEGARLLEESTAWMQTLTSFGQSWRRAPVAEERGPFIYLRGLESIGSFISGLTNEIEQEVLTAQPQTGRDTAGLPRSAAAEKALLDRGVSVRTLYQHVARRSPATRQYVAEIERLGAEVRTLDEFFNRMIVVDRRVAIIPAPSDLTVAVAVREPTIVDYLADVFERSWSRARPFNVADVASVKAIQAEQRALTMRMLAEGQSDPAAAKRLGVSPRTYAGYVADLKREFDVETRFQLGYVLGQANEADSEGG